MRGSDSAGSISGLILAIYTLKSILIEQESIHRTIVLYSIFDYATRMNFALDLYPDCLHLLVAPRPEVDRLTDAFIARLALSGPVRVLDGGNRFDVHRIARHIRRQTALLNPALERINLARAFTCYQVVALLVDQKAGETPVLALNLLTTFKDENVPQLERKNLLRNCVINLKRLAVHSPVLVSATPGAAQGDNEFLAYLSVAADHTWRFEHPDLPTQARLF